MCIFIECKLRRLTILSAIVATATGRCKLLKTWTWRASLLMYIGFSQDGINGRKKTKYITLQLPYYQYFWCNTFPMRSFCKNWICSFGLTYLSLLSLCCRPLLLRDYCLLCVLTFLLWIFYVHLDLIFSLFEHLLSFCHNFYYAIWNRCEYDSLIWVL